MTEEKYTLNSENCDLVSPSENKIGELYKRKRDIFRFLGPNQDMALSLEYVYKITLEGKKVNFFSIHAQNSDYAFFDTEEGAKLFYEQILKLWSGDVLE